MEHSAPKSVMSESMLVGRLLWVGALAAVFRGSGFVRRRGLFERR